MQIYFVQDLFGFLGNFAILYNIFPTGDDVGASDGQSVDTKN